MPHRTACLAAVLILGAFPANAQRVDTTIRRADRPVRAGVAKLVAEVSIGALDGPDELIFGDVAEIAVARDGSMFVFDRSVPALRQYDANGRFVRTLGRRGNGPGEYISGGGLAIHPDGRILLWDTGNWRVNVYSPSGAVLPSWLTPSGATGNATLTTSHALVIDTAGLVYYRRANFIRRATDAAPVDQWVRLRGDGTVVDTINAPSFAGGPAMLSATSPSGNSRTSTNIPFSAPRLSVLSRLGYFVTAVPERYAFEILAPGRPVHSVRREVPATRVTSRERDSARRSVEERMKQVEPLWRWNGPDIPQTKPLFSSLYVGDDGRIWLPIIPESGPRQGSVSGIGGRGGRFGAAPPRPLPDPGPARPALYDVFEPDGTYLGQVETPPRFASVFRRGDHIWGVELDEDDVPHVKRYRIQWR